MAIILREPRNPLADALGTLSQQILADAASRKGREFRSAEMEKERAFMGSENAAVRELQRTENEARMRYLTQVAADTRLSDQERTAAMRELGLAQTEMQGRVGMAQAGAAGAQGAALLEEARGRGRRQETMLGLMTPLLQALTLDATQPSTTSGGPRKNYVELTPEQTKFFNEFDWKVDGGPVGRYLTPEQARTIAGGQGFGRSLMGGEWIDYFRQGDYNQQLLRAAEDTETGILGRQDASVSRQQNLGNLVQALSILSQVSQ